MEKDNRNFIVSGEYSQFPDMEMSTPLYESEGHVIYWLGITAETAFRCNSYLILDGDEALLVDPGGKGTFSQVCERVAQIIEPEKVTGMILCHQDPDVAASMTDWLEINPSIQVYSSPRTHVLLPHYGKENYPSRDIEEESVLTLPSGSRLIFKPAPFLHFAGAFVTFDEASGCLFSGDIWAALDIDWQLVVDDFENHVVKMDLFHKDYMASNLATQGFINSLRSLNVRAILPQHGSIISEKHVEKAMEYLQNLECGTDLIYPSENILKSHIDSADETSISAEDENVDTVSKKSEKVDDKPTKPLQESLSQAARLASMRDKALKDLKIAESRLQTSEAQLKEAQKIAHIGHWNWEIDCNRLSWSEEIYKIFGLSQGSEISYDVFLDSVHPDDRILVQDAVKLTLEKDIPYSVEHRIVLPDGTTRIVKENAQITRDDEGRATLMFGTVQDITESKLTEEALRYSYKVIETIDQLQSEFIEYNRPFPMYEKLLHSILELTQSPYGFISEVLKDPDGEQYLRIYAITDLSWDEESEKLYETFRKENFEFRNLDNLIGHVVTSGKVVLSNNPEHDPRYAGLPKGHPKIDSFLGIPVYNGKELVGVIGLANREEGFKYKIVDDIEPVITACGQVITARHERNARRLAEERLSTLASQDGLTGIPNRRRFDEYLAQEWQRAKRSGLPISLLMIDIDHFKFYNDRYGHQAGDACLKKVASGIDEILHRPADVVARYGGEEFACILPETSHQGAVFITEAIMASIEKMALEHDASPVSKYVTVSIGVSTMIASKDRSFKNLIEQADQRLYKAKEEGRNRYIIE